jgi:hypothetical protein
MGVQKNSVDNSLPKTDKKPKPIFVDLFYHIFGRFSVRGVQKFHQNNIETKNLATDPGSFWATDPPTTGSPIFVHSRSDSKRPSAGVLLKNTPVVFSGSSCRKTAKNAIKKIEGQDDRIFFLSTFSAKSS